MVQAIPHRKIRFPRDLRKPVPRADDLAIVAAVHPVTDQRPQLLRDGGLVLDGQVGDAAPRVELVGPADGLGGAYLDAPLAGSTMIFFRDVTRQRQVAVHLAKEEPRARSEEHTSEL